MDEKYTIQSRKGSHNQNGLLPHQVGFTALKVSQERFNREAEKKMYKQNLIIYKHLLTIEKDKEKAKFLNLAINSNQLQNYK